MGHRAMRIRGVTDMVERRSSAVDVNSSAGARHFDRPAARSLTDFMATYHDRDRRAANAIRADARRPSQPPSRTVLTTTEAYEIGSRLNASTLNAHAILSQQEKGQIGSSWTSPWWKRGAEPSSPTNLHAAYSPAGIHKHAHPGSPLGKRTQALPTSPLGRRTQTVNVAKALENADPQYVRISQDKLRSKKLVVAFATTRGFPSRKG